MEFFDALCSEIPGVAVLSADEVLCYMAGIALVEFPMSPDRCMVIDELVAMEQCSQPLLNAEGTLPRLEAMRQEQCSDGTDFEEEMEAWDDELLSAIVVELGIDFVLTSPEQAELLERVANALRLDPSRLVILNADSQSVGRRRRAQDAVVRLATPRIRSKLDCWRTSL